MDVTAAHIGVGREEFLSNLAAAELLNESDLKALQAETQSDVMQLADTVLRKGLITPYQLDAIVAGRPQDLKVGNYTLLSKLGQGGMGVVFKARHRRMKRMVAIKVLSAQLCQDESFVARFQREVETIARLGHPNIVMAYDADEAEIGHFLVMEFVEGRDLASEIAKKGPAQLPLAVDYILQTARGLAYAHSQNIVHRDIKPHNLLLDELGVVKVTDLGLAALSSGDKTAGSGLTQSGGILGTVDYMPPEQAVDSASIDARADIYSLGCTLYYLLTGTPPFSGPSMMSVLLKHRDAPIPKLSSTHGPVPPGLEAIYEKMMAKSVATRYQSMGEVIQELEQIRLQLGSVPGANISSQTTGIFHPSSISSIAILRPDQKTIVARPVENSAISVLVVEPSRLQAGFIRKYLEQSAIRVLSSVTTGAAAEQAIRMEKPTAIVSSLYLSDMTGLELAQKIRADYPSAAPGFVLISSESESSEAQQLSQLNRVLLLPKPFGPEQLVSSVHLVTGQSISGRAGLAPPITRRNRAELRVLVVDDSSTARVHERIILNQLGFTQIHEASDGAQAIAAATREAFDLIVTDYNMPLLDGRALVSYLKQTTSTAAVPIVMVTTETEARILDPVRELGVAEIFPKAFPSDQVESLMKKLFG